MDPHMIEDADGPYVENDDDKSAHARDCDPYLSDIIYGRSRGDGTVEPPRTGQEILYAGGRGGGKSARIASIAEQAERCSVLAGGEAKSPSYWYVIGEYFELAQREGVLITMDGDMFKKNVEALHHLITSRPQDALFLAEQGGCLKRNGRVSHQPARSSAWSLPDEERASRGRLVLAPALRALKLLAHKASLDAGWWNSEDGRTGGLLNSSYTPYVIATKIALIGSEINEALEGYRTDAQDDKLPHRKAVEVELADALIRIFDIAEALNLDLAGAIFEKMDYNRSRADHKTDVRKAKGGKRF